MPFDRVEDAIEDIRQGRMVIVADDEDRENEGDLVLAAAAVTPDHINFMTQFGRGLICVAMTAERADELDLPLDDRHQHRPAGHGVHGVGRRPPALRGHHRNQRARPCQDRADPPRPRHPTLRPAAARPHLPAARQARRGLAQGGADRGGRGPRAPGRLPAHGCHLRDPEPGRHDGPAAPARALRRRAWHPLHHGSAARGLPAHEDPPGAPHRRDRASDP